MKWFEDRFWIDNGRKQYDAELASFLWDDDRSDFVTELLQMIQDRARQGRVVGVKARFCG